jgi:hypothetical protein
MGNSPSINLYGDDVYDRFYTMGCNSRLHTRYVPDMTLMIDRNLPSPNPDCEIATQLEYWHSHRGPVWTFRTGRRLQFHPDLSSDMIDYSITSPYMAICMGYLMGWRTFTLIGIDLGLVDGRNYHDDKEKAPVVTRPGYVMADGKEIVDPLATRRRFLGACYNHLSYLINKMSSYHRCRFFSLSPYSQLLQNGNVKRTMPP